jgi:hypothetical protein
MSAGHAFDEDDQIGECGSDEKRVIVMARSNWQQ